MKRYDFRETDVYLGETPEGSFVRYDDAEELIHENAALQAELAMCKEFSDAREVALRANEEEISILKAEVSALRNQPHLYPPCKGANCVCTDGVSHLLECFAEHEAAITGGKNDAEVKHLKNKVYRMLVLAERIVADYMEPASDADYADVTLIREEVERIIAEGRSK